MLFDCGLSPRTVKQGFEIYSAPWKKTLHAVGGVCKGQGDPLGLGLGVAVGARARPTHPMATPQPSDPPARIFINNLSMESPPLAETPPLVTCDSL